MNEEINYYNLTDERIYYLGARTMLQALLDHDYILQQDKPVKAHNKDGERVKISDSKQGKMIITANCQKMLRSRYYLEWFLSGENRATVKWYDENGTDYRKCNIVTPMDEMRGKQAAMELLFDMATKKDKNEPKPLDVGFKVLKLVNSDTGDTELDYLFEILLDLGIQFDTKIEKREANGNTVYIADNGNLYVCFDENVNDEVAKSIACCLPLYVIFNIRAITPKLENIFKRQSPYTLIKAVDYGKRKTD